MGGGGIPACIAGGIPASLAGLRGGVVSQHTLQVSRPTPKGGVEGSEMGVSRPTPRGVSRPTPQGLSQHALRQTTPPPPQQTATAAGGMHPTGMHSFLNYLQ